MIPMSPSVVEIGDKVTIQVTGKVVNIYEDWFGLDLGNSNDLTCQWTDAKLIKKHTIYKVGQEITRTEQMDLLPSMTAVRNKSGSVYQKYGDLWIGGPQGHSYISSDFHIENINYKPLVIVSVPENQ